MIQNQSCLVTESDLFIKAVSDVSALSFSDLKDLASERWLQVTSTLRGSGLELLTISPLAKAADLYWPSNRTSECLVSFIELASPDHLLRLSGFGKRKAYTLLAIILSLFEIVGEEFQEEAAARNDKSEREIVIPNDPVARVEIFWSRIRERIVASEIADEKFSILARQWGFPWPSKSKVEYALGDAVRMNSLSEFMINSRGLGKKKKPSIATIIWRAWTEVEPDGPAGPPRLGIEVAKDEFEVLAEHADVLGIIRKCFDLAGLKERHRSILMRRYGLINGIPMTLEDIGRSDQVTRERIRQLQQAAENKIMYNQTSSTFLQLALHKELPEILHHLEKNSSSALLKTDGDWHRKLIPSHCFLIEVIHGNVLQFFDQLVAIGVIQKTSAGWWLGSSLSDDCVMLAKWIRERLIAENRPLSLAILAEEKEVVIEKLADAAWSAGMRIEMGYVSTGRLTTPERRCLFCLRIASEAQRWLWPELDFYQAAIAKSALEAGSMRLLTRDAECIPGVAINIPGPFVVINPIAAKNHGLPALSTEAPECDWENGDEEKDQEPADNLWEHSQGITIASQLESLMSRYRILKYETLENYFCEARIAPPGSLGPTLLSKPQFVRYAPAYWGLIGLQLEGSDVELLCNEEDLDRYVKSKRLGGIFELFPFWCPEMEYRWCRWAESHSNEDLFYSLLAICEPETWPLSKAIQNQWEGKKSRLGIHRLPPIQGNLDMGYIDFDEIYGLVHLASQRGSIGPATIPHFYGLREADRKALGTMALLGVLGILVPRVDLDSPWVAGPRLNEWLQLMSELHYRDPMNAGVRWIDILERSVEVLDPEESFGWFTGEELQEGFNRWKA